MKIKDKAKPKASPVAPGVYMAVCVGIVDLGEQYSEKYKYYSNRIQIIWELAGETIEVDGQQQPRQLSREYAVTSSKKGSLRGLLSTWNGVEYSDADFKELELFDQIGRPCQVQVVLSDDGEHGNIQSVMGIPKGMPVPTASTPPIRWDMEHWDDETFEKLPQWLQDKIKKSTQYQKLHAPTDKVDFPDPDKPAEGRTEECPI